MAEQVGAIYYDVNLDTRQLVDDARVVDREARRAAGGLDQIDFSLNRIVKALGLYAAALQIVKAANTADDMRLLAARVQVAAGSIENAAAAMAQLQQISARTGTAVSDNAAVFTKLNSSIRQMGGNQNDTLRVTELLGMSIKVSGASAQEASAAMLQFGQALGSGKLQGDELRSLTENAPYLMQQLADAMGIPIGQLKQLGAEGKLTSDVIVNALTKAGDKIRSDFSQLGPTLASQWTVAKDALSRLTSAMDDASGSSAKMTGVLKGAGAVVDMLAQQFQDAARQSSGLSRDEQIKSWAQTTTTVLSYLIDAVEFVKRGFQQTGVAIGGLAASGTALASGEWRRAGDILRQMGKDITDIGNAKFAGQQMRELVTIARTEDRGFTPQTQGSALKPPTVVEKSNFDAIAYLTKLREATAEEFEKISLIEAEALRKNAAQEGLSIQQREEAAKLIRTKASQDRVALEEKINERLLTEATRRETERARLEADLQRGRTFAQGVITRDDPIARLQIELERKSALLAEYAAKDEENASLYAEARVQLEADTQAAIRAEVAKSNAAQIQAQSTLLSASSQLFAALADSAQRSGDKQSETYKALFAVSKAFAIAESIIKIQQGVANALSLPYPENLVAAGATVAAAANIVSTISGTNFGGGRQYGGPVSAGSLYRVNETGAPEMFTANNGAQFMLPTASGNVTPASGVGGAGGITVIMQNMGTPQQVVSSTTESDGRIVRLVTADLSDQVRSNSGAFWQALRSSTNVRPGGI